MKNERCYELYMKKDERVEKKRYERYKERCHEMIIWKIQRKMSWNNYMKKGKYQQKKTSGMEDVKKWVCEGSSQKMSM